MSTHKTLYEHKLEVRKKKSKKDNIITDMDYVFRIKDEKDRAKNTRDMTPDGVAVGDYEAKHKKEINEFKKKLEDANKEDDKRAKEIDELKDQISKLAALIDSKETEENPKPTTRNKTTGAK